MKRWRKTKPRFVVRSVTGFPINVNSAAHSGRDRTFWYVLDSAVCYRVAAERVGMNAEVRAREVAAGLNAEHENYLWEIGWTG